MWIVSIQLEERSQGADEILLWIPQTGVAIGSVIFFICITHHFLKLFLLNQMLEVYLTIFFISLLLIFLGSGVWVGISMIGVSTIGMMMFTSRPVGDAMATTMEYGLVLVTYSFTTFCLDGRNFVQNKIIRKLI